MGEETLKLLLVEDSKQDARLIEILLGQADSPIDIKLVETMSSALQTLADDTFDCVMLDLGLPDGQGLENIHRIRSLKSDLPIVVMTGLNDQQTAAAALEQGAQEYIVKGSYDDGNSLFAVLDKTVHRDRKQTSVSELGLKIARHPKDHDTFRCDAQGNITEWGEGPERVYGRGTDSALGENVSILIPESLRDELTLINQKLAEGQIIDGLETQRIRPDGEIRDVELFVTPELDPDGRLISSTWVSRDITDQRQAQYAALQFTAIVESASDAILGTRLDGTIANWNKGATTLLGYGLNDAIGRHLKELVQPDLSEDFSLKLKQAVNGHSITNLDSVMVHKDGSQIAASISLSPVRDNFGGVTGVSAIIRDVRELKHAQDQLVEAEKLASLGGLVAGVAHEINTPVGVGVTAASHLRMKIEQLQTAFSEGKLKKSDLERFIENADEATRMILSNLNRAANLIQSFKHVAVDQTSGEIRRFNMREYIDEILTSLNPRIKRTQVKIHVDCPEDLEIESIPGIYSQIISNVVMNSLIHAYDPDDEGHINIKASVSDDLLILNYRDDGKGMSKEHLDKLYEPFFTTKRGYGGSGLGMHIVHNLVHQKLGGTIMANSEPGQGFALRISIPLHFRQLHKQQAGDT